MAQPAAAIDQTLPAPVKYSLRQNSRGVLLRIAQLGVLRSLLHQQESLCSASLTDFRDQQVSYRLVSLKQLLSWLAASSAPLAR